MNILPLIKTSLNEPIFKSFEEFEQEALNRNKFNSIEAALQISLRCSNLGQAFAAGYRCALQALVPDLNNNNWAAMCVTEVKGNHPRQLETIVDEQGVLTGAKSFVTMASAAKQLVVIAKAGETDQFPILKAVLVNHEHDSSGIQINDMPSLGMIPDIHHGQLNLTQATGSILPGDGHTNYSKRFRTLEDLHVLTAFTALVLSMSYRYKLPDSVFQQGLFLLNFVSSNDLNESELQHLNIHQAFQYFEKMVAGFMESASLLPKAFVEDWKRDSKLFKIASKARNVRRERALKDIMGVA